MLKSIRPQKIRAVLFDLDGTLIDSEAAWYAACNETMRNYEMPIVTWDVFEREFIGVAVRKNIDRTFIDFSEDEKDIIESKYKQGFVRNLGLVNLKECSNQVLSLVKKKGLRCALVTNAPRQIVETITQNFRIDSYFEVSVCEGEAERSKPSPDPVIKACSLIEVNPSEVVYVEDSVAGVMAGKSAGCYTVAIGDVKLSQRLINAGAREVFDGLSVLYDFLGRIS